VKTFILSHPQARLRASAACMESEDGCLVKIMPPEKTRDQEKLAHSCYHDFAMHALLDGKRATDEDWKRSLKLQFWDETGADPEWAQEWKGRAPTLTPVPGTRYVIATEIASAKFPRRLYRAYIDFLHAKGDELGVQWSPQSLGREAATA
jgi:hypothetical protein